MLHQFWFALFLGLIQLLQSLKSSSLFKRKFMKNKEKKKNFN